MAVIFELRTFSDLYTAVLEELKIQADDTTTLNRIKRDINIIYMNEVVPYERWKWLRRYTDLSHPAAFTDTTTTVTINDTDVTLGVAPGLNVTGYNFSIDGQNQTYKIAHHVASSTSIELEAPFIGASLVATAVIKIWRPEVPLPVDCRETVEIHRDRLGTPLEGLGEQEIKKVLSTAPKTAGAPKWYSTSGWVDPSPFSAITSLPALSTRASAGLEKTLVYASTVAALVQVGDKIKVFDCADDTYNGQFFISSVATTTVKYTGLMPLTESAVADAALTIQLKDGGKHYERYRQLVIHPSIHNEKTTLHVDYIMNVTPLSDDADEPLMPIGDRIVILYGALSRAWSRERNPEESATNAQRYSRKLEKMQGKLGDSTDNVQLVPNKNYIATKRFQRGGRVAGLGAFGSDFGGGGSGGGGTTPTGTASRVAIFGTDGLLKADAAVSTTELAFLDTTLSQVVGISDTNTLTNKSIDSDNNTITNIVNADIKAAAAIARTKIANGTADHVIINDGSGTFSSEATLAISRGGTNGATATAAFDNLSPTTTKGDIIVDDGSNDIRLAVGTDTHVLTADAAQASGIKWAAASVANSSNLIENLGYSLSVGSSALTITLEQSDGSTDPTSGAPVKLGFRSGTITTAGYNVRSVTSAITLVINSTATLGFTSGNTEYLYIWAIDVAGTVELAVSGANEFDETDLHSTTAIGTGSDDANTLYSTTGRTTEPIRLIGRVKFSLTTAGTWDETGDQLDVAPIEVNHDHSKIIAHSPDGHGSSGTNVRTFGSTIETGAAITYANNDTTGDTFTINKAGVYSMVYIDDRSGADTQCNIGIGRNVASLTTDPDVIDFTEGKLISSNNTSTPGGTPRGVSVVAHLKVGDVIRAHDNGASDATEDTRGFTIERISD